MIHENSSDIIRASKAITLTNNEPAECLEFHNGLVLLLTQNTLAMFKSIASVNDPLGNGLIASTELTPEHLLTMENEAFIKSFRAGFVGLTDGKALLVTPNHIQLFPSANDALRNQNELAILALD